MTVVSGGTPGRPRAALTAIRTTAVRLYGLSRGTQAALSVAQPCLGLLLAAGMPPPAGTALLCLAAATTGSFAGFALHDLMDLRLDRSRFAHQRPCDAFDIDIVGPRHPLAQGKLSTVTAVVWTVLLASVSLTLSALLDPVCVALFVTAVSLQLAYCALATVTAYKFLLTGLTVAAWASAGWFAADPRPEAGGWLLPALFAGWMAAWEIGGRNIVNDWADVEEDRHLGVRTVPAVYGVRTAGLLTLVFLAAAWAGGIAVPALGGHGPAALLGTAIAGTWLLLAPGWRLLRDGSPQTALGLFNRASFYPPVVLLLLVCAPAADRALGL
ncbi:UbiA family prenyltransferase [Streptomyces sp. YIM 98790]|uniref:UbiA prenyltransferase family protein n=1 Tax=Streptomyces sp. YIM 98790 TaxID=2689077 RepID=UPI0028BD6FC1|nr:UbiA family prenyltransferase [Streptomyces sp. YIM 98790]